MRLLYFSLFTISILAACSPKMKPVPPVVRILHSADSGEISFPLQTKDVGSVDGNSMVYYDFKFYNSGSGPLKVTDVKTACSCTVPRWTLTEVMPGDSGVISIAFDTKGYAGHFDKWITVYATGKRPTAVLYLVGQIKMQ